MTKRVCFEIDADLYQKFKSLCVVRKDTVKEVLSILICDYVRKYNDIGDLHHVKDDDKD